MVSGWKGKGREGGEGGEGGEGRGGEGGEGSRGRGGEGRGGKGRRGGKGGKGDMFKNAFLFLSSFLCVCSQMRPFPLTVKPSSQPTQ